jgi:MoaA/NifB/PqqE/SkfB family radical SAM enzyme
LIPQRLRRRVYRWLYPEQFQRRIGMNIDIVGACNLRCPSCPVGNMGPINGTGLMDKGLFTRIIEKAKNELSVGAVNLFNWTEPLLHPELPEFIRTVKRHGLPCSISSNLNVMKNIEEVLRAGPDDFRISLSGFSQRVYSQTHVRGDIERVRDNMRILSETKRRIGNRVTRVHVYFHKYRHNLHEVDLMRKFAAELGFDWMDHWAYYMPLERTLELVEGTLPEAQQRFVDEFFALPIRAAIRATGPFKSERCSLLEDQITVNHDGNVLLCCTVYDYKKNTLGQLLDMSAADLERAKSRHPTCDRCTEHGLHVYFNYHSFPTVRENFDDLAKRNVAKLANIPAPLVALPVVSSPGAAVER